MKRSEQGDATAQFNLGMLYENGEGLAQDYAEAVRWYRKAADQGVIEAQYNLASYTSAARESRRTVFKRSCG